MLDDCQEPWKTWTKLMFLNQTMHSLWNGMEMSKGFWRTLTRLMFLNQTMYSF
jgi:hypothetical protein